MKSTALRSAMLAVVALQTATLIPSRSACCYFSSQNNDVLQPGQKAFISWDEDTGTETFTVQPKFEGSVKDFGMVIPTPARPKLDEMPRDFFKSLAVFTILDPVDWDKFSKPSQSGKGAPPACEAASDDYSLKRRASTVKVVEAGVVGTLDYKIITAERADDLYDWLKSNNYSYAGDEATLDFYVKRKWYFTVMKIDTKQIRQGTFRKKFTGELTPTRFSFKSGEIIYPLRITEKSVKDRTEVLLYVQAPYKVDMSATASYQDSWQWMWRQAFDMADPKKMTEAEREWYDFTAKLTEPCYDRVKKLQGAGMVNATLEWARRLTPKDLRVLSGEAKFTREAPAADVAAMNCLRGHLQAGQYVTKIRKVFTKPEMTGDIVFRPASFGGRRDSMEYIAALPQFAAVNRSAAILLLLTAAARGQLTERPGGSEDNPVDTPRDLSGLSLKNPRIRIQHTTDPSLEGGSMWLQERDPWLAWQWGRSLFQREFRDRDGVYGDAGKLDGPLLPDGATHMQTRSHVSSCAACHATPYRDAGAGGTIAKNGGTGRNTPHLFGGGLIEMIGQQLRLEITRAADTDGNGWISLAEANDRRCLVQPLTGGKALDFGRFDDADHDGWPDLNGIVFPVFVDEDGLRMPVARNLSTPGVAGYRVDVQVFGFAHLRAPNRPPLPSTVRAFAANTFDMHMGLQPCDPSGLEDDDGDGFSRPTNAGCPQPATIAARDRGRVLTKTGISTDDPDRDGWCHEISEGEMDVFEWYALNHPRPGRGEITEAVRRGEEHFLTAGCASCHTPDWELRTGPGYSGDRRFFDLDVSWQPEGARLAGKLVLSGKKRGGFRVAGVFSDFRWHDMGDGFAQMQYDGTVVRQWRTTPLWGIADTAPFGHDGASASLDAVIRRHGGESTASRNAYAALSALARQELIAFLQSMVLYSVDQVPCDIDGDGKISDHFTVAGMDTGVERLNPEWLLRFPGQIEGPVRNPRGETVTSFALTNVRKAYGLDLKLLRDRDGDGFPDIMDPAPDVAGFRDGVQ